MILKFVLYPTAKRETVQEIFVECGGFNQSYFEPDDEMNGHAHFAINGTRGPNAINEMEIDCANTVVYVMNDSGKTVDSYRWTKTEDGAIKRM